MTEEEDLTNIDRIRSNSAKTIFIWLLEQISKVIIRIQDNTIKIKRLNIIFKLDAANKLKKGGQFNLIKLKIKYENDS